MKTYELFIGANNDTKQVELGKIEEILSRHFEGFTIKEVVGYWLGARENSVAVTIVATQEQLFTTLAELKQELAQDAIAYHSVAMLQFA